MTLEGKRAVITGASRGFGLAVARKFVSEGARVLICARDSGELTSAATSLEAISPGCVEAVTCDVGLEMDVDALAARAVSALGGIDILVVNAGVYGPKGPIESVDWTQWLDAIRINLIGAVYCCRAFLPILKRASRGKILILSGGGATRPLPSLSAYAASKAGLVRFGETLAEEIRELKIDVNMIAPGALNTRMLEEVLEAGPDKVGASFFESALRQKASGGTPLELGVDLCACLASAVGDGITGRLFSAQWDPWRKLADFKDDLQQTDIYTLRRIVPEDRGRKWDAL